MTTSLNGRVRALERHERRGGACRSCGGRDLHILEPGGGVPSWLDASSCCRTCGQGVKCYDRDMWDRLA